MSTFSNTPLTIDELPKVADITFTALDPKYRWINLSQPLLILAIISTPMVILSFITDQLSLGYLGWGLYCVIVLLSFAYHYVAATKRRYALREADLLYQEGIFWHTTTAVAFNRVQHIDLTHGPLERKYNIATIKCFTAGGSSVDLKVPGLPKEDAEVLRAFILSKTAQADATTGPDDQSDE